MASTAQAPSTTPRRDHSRTRWFLLGLCAALGYGVSQRLIELRFSSSWHGHQPFEVRPFPGTELNSLRRRLGVSSMEIRGDLDLLELERHQREEAVDLEQRREAMAERERQQEEGERSNAEPPQGALEPEAGLPPLPEPPELPAPEPAPPGRTPPDPAGVASPAPTP